MGGPLIGNDKLINGLMATYNDGLMHLRELES